MKDLRQRMQDVDFSSREMTARDDKGGKNQLAPMPQSLAAGLQEYLLTMHNMHQNSLATGWEHMLMP